MKKFTKLLTLLIVLVMVLQSFALSVFAIEPIDLPQYQLNASGQPSSYSTTYNSGERDVVATTLSGTGADDYYTGSYDFDVLSTQSASAILSSLRTLMTSTHKKTTTYSECKSMAIKTDCENENGKVVLLYTSYTTTGSGDWNREHVWPKSLGGFSTSGPGADLHHIRPTDNRVNSVRGNDKFGNNTNGKEVLGGNAASGVLGGYTGTYFEPLDNVKGDVARICLYMYVRYGGSYSKCSSITNVFQSIDVLLEWCEMDPVDTWELGRNEVVGAYQGNRNVFIDYPEYAWLLFGRDVPEDLVTPSGEASGGIEGDGSGGSSGTVPENPMSDKEILDAAYGLSAGQSLDGIYTLTGVITKLDSYNNPTIVVGNYTSQPMYCYRLVDDRFEIGATITVTGEITNYQGLIEMKNCSLISITLPSDEPDTPDVPDTPDIPDEPTDPTVNKAEFISAVNALSSYSGEELYTKLCEAVALYNSLSEADKAAVSAEYANLVSYVESYNEDIDSANGDAGKASSQLLVYSFAAIIALPAIGYCLFGKKRI